MTCFCGSKKAFNACCEPIITKDNAQSPEQLMRSRYSAFATGNMLYVYNTYSKESQSSLNKQDFLNIDDEPLWCGLTVINATDNSVEFKAYSKHQKQLFVLHEDSHFIQENGHWRYHDGNILFSGPVKLSRNAECICGSGKKYKRCCMLV